MTINRTQNVITFDDCPVEWRNSSGAPPNSGNSTTPVRIAFPNNYPSNLFSLTTDGFIQANGVQIPTPCSIAWKSNVVELTNELEWVDNMNMYSFVYDDVKL